MNYKIVYDSAPKPEQTQKLWEGISAHAAEVRGLHPGKPFAFFIKNSLNFIKGGCSGYIFYGSLYVDLLWVEPLLRGQDYGTQLMESAEILARENGCYFMTVNTMDFEALDFYKKLGFIVEFERSGYDNNSVFYFLRKDL
jgi:GNAT superfamily N-acetyltransferase